MLAPFVRPDSSHFVSARLRVRHEREEVVTGLDDTPFDSGVVARVKRADVVRVHDGDRADQVTGGRERVFGGHATTSHEPSTGGGQ